MPGQTRLSKFALFLHSRNSITLYSFSYLYSFSNGEGERQKTKHIRHEDKLKLLEAQFEKITKQHFKKLYSQALVARN